MLNEYVSKERELYKDIVGEEFFARHVTSMSEIERRYVETIVNDSIIKNGIIFTRHALERMAERNLSKTRMQIAIRNGAIQEVQFNKDGARVVLSFASPQQLKKGYLNYVVYDITNGHVMSLFNKQKHKEAKIDPQTFNNENTGKKYILDKNCMALINSYLHINPSNEEIVKIVRKYDCSNMPPKLEKKLNNFRKGVTLLTQL